MKNVLVTGALGGMGRETVKLLEGAGYNVIRMDRAEICESGYISCDITSITSVNAAAESLRKLGLRLDAVIHMAGIYDLNSLVEIEEAEFKRIFEVNLFGVYRLNKALLSLFNDNARIIITSSELAPLMPLPFTGIYAVTKTALERYAYSLRMELQLLGHKVIVIRPGAVDTGLLNVSTDRLEAFCNNTVNYSVNAGRFKRIVDSVEARSVHPSKVAKKARRALTAKNPRFVYKLNRNPLLLLLNILPQRMQTWIIKIILN